MNGPAGRHPGSGNPWGVEGAAEQEVVLQNPRANVFGTEVMLQDLKENGYAVTQPRRTKKGVIRTKNSHFFVLHNLLRNLPAKPFSNTTSLHNLADKKSALGSRSRPIVG